MANIKISQLPSYTGTAADLRWFVMNNSGETETYKFSGYTSPLRFTSPTNIKPVYSSAVLSNDFNQIFGGSGNTINSTAGNNNYIFGGENNAINASRDQNMIIGGYGNTITNVFGGYYGSIICGFGNTMNAGGWGSVMVGGYNNYSSDYGNWSSAVIGGESLNHAGGGWSFMGAGKNNQNNATYGSVIGGYSNNNQSASGSIIGGNAVTISSTGNNNGVFVSENVSITAGNNSTIIGSGDYTTIQNSQCGAFGSNRATLAGQTSYDFGGYYNSTANGRWKHHFGGTSNVLNGTGQFHSIIGGTSNSISSSDDYSAIYNSTNCSMTRSKTSSIINSINSTQNANPSPYSTSGVTMIGCSGTDATNLNNSVVLGVSGKTINGGGESGRAYMDKPYILGNIIWDVTTVNDAGTVNINVFTDAMTIINVTGGTYDLTITPVPNDPGTEVTLMINYVSGTVNFVGSGSVQWRWGNGLGAPTFSANTLSIIKMATWAGNDLWEVSRSMNMS